MSSIAFDLGHWDASRSLAESSTTYANIAGHSSLEAWTLGLQATLANWRRDLSGAAAAFERGMAVAPQGATRFRLRHIAARTRSAAGDRASVEALLASAESDRETADSLIDEFEHEIGGEFAFDAARAAACAAAAWLDLQLGERAEAEASRALELYGDIQEADRPFSPINGLRIDVSSARVLRGNIDGAADALTPVLELEPAKRNSALTGRMASVRASLSVPMWARLSVATDLIEEIDEWGSETSATHQPSDGIS